MLRFRRVAGLIVVTGLAVMLGGVAGASAATVQVVDGTAVFSAGNGERNDVRAGGLPDIESPSPTTEIADAGALLVAGPGCVQVDVHSAYCPGEDPSASDPMPLVISTGGAADRVVVDDPVGLRPVTIDGGAGADVLHAGSHSGGPAELIGGPGDDVLTTSTNGLGLPTLRGGAGDDVLKLGGAAGGKAFGGAGRDQISFCCGFFPLELDGGPGADTYAFESGDVRADGVLAGPGADSLDHSLATRALTFDLSACPGCFEQVVGSSLDDSITGDADGPGDRRRSRERCARRRRRPRRAGRRRGRRHDRRPGRLPRQRALRDGCRRGGRRPMGPRRQGLRAGQPRLSRAARASRGVGRHISSPAASITGRTSIAVWRASGICAASSSARSTVSHSTA